MGQIVAAAPGGATLAPRRRLAATEAAMAKGVDGVSAGVTSHAALLAARVLLGLGLLVAGGERAGLVSGHCLRDAAPRCEAEERARCGQDAACRALVAPRCVDARAAACREAAATSSRWAAGLTPFGVAAWKIPVPGRLLLLATAALEIVAGVLVLSGLWARLGAAIALAVLTFWLSTATRASFGPDLRALTEPAMLQAALAALIAAIGPGAWALRRGAAAKAGGAKGGAAKPATGAAPRKQAAAPARLAQG